MKHNLLVIGYPIEDSLFDDCEDPEVHENPFKIPMTSYSRLETSLICFVDALGNSFLMPCLC